MQQNSFFPRPKGSGDIACLSHVRPDTFSFPLYNFNFGDTSQLCRTDHGNMMRTTMRDLALILFKLPPL